MCFGCPETARSGAGKMAPDTPGRLRSAYGPAQMPRPPLLIKRDQRLSIKLTRAEHALVQTRAEAAELRLAIYARMVLIGEPVRHEITLRPTGSDRLAYQQWVRAGSNLNQIARRLNGLGHVSGPEIEAALEEIRALIAEARRE